MVNYFELWAIIKNQLIEYNLLKKGNILLLLLQMAKYDYGIVIILIRMLI